MKDKKDKKDSGSFKAAGDILGGLFKGLSHFIDLADKATKEGSGVLQRGGEFTIPGEKEAKGVYGFTIRTMMGPSGEIRPRVEPFGNIKKTPQGPIVEEEREPIIDVFEEKDVIQVVAELPGVSESEITYEINGDVLTLRTIGKRKYHKEVLLSSPVLEEGIEKTYRNGMFEVKCKKKKS